MSKCRSRRPGEKVVCDDPADEAVLKGLPQSVDVYLWGENKEPASVFFEIHEEDIDFEEDEDIHSAVPRGWHPVAMDVTEKLLPIEQVARLMRVPIKWLRVEAEAGRIPCMRAGRRLRFNVDAVERCLLQRAAGVGCESTEDDRAT